MNYTDFQRRLLIDPRSPELAEAARARVGDDATAQLAEALNFEKRIDAALAVPVPANLAERILAAIPAQADARPTSSPRRWWPLAMAASLVAVAVISSGIMHAPGGTTALITASVEHLSHEPYALTRVDPVPQRLIKRMFTDAGLKLDSSGLALSYLNRCPLDRRWSVHMVMPAPEGPVTVMYVLGEAKVERMDIRHEMVAVRTLPFASGALVLLAESNRDFDRIEDAWHQAAGESVALVGGGE
ncbi:MAG TPA: DUF3379 family protein [Xanthomonadales bacterium]|nr:DUF3379 family protein [Xanthomonadales bacterium]